MERAKKSRLQRILAILQQAYPEARCALHFTTPLELLIATILSAQCTDARVNQVTQRLFQKYHTAADYLAVAPAELEQDIQPTGFYRQKAQTIQRCCEVLLTCYGGVVPQTMQELVALPGVGRKTANVVLGNAFHRPAGVAVDTHVKRLAQRLGLTTAANPDRIEQDLLGLVPQEQWTLVSHWLIFHGRAVCKARTPQCEICPIHDLCPSYQQQDRGGRETKKPYSRAPSP
jgi:endonuclease III